MLAAVLVAAAPVGASADTVRVGMNISNLRGDKGGMILTYDSGFRGMGGQFSATSGSVAAVVFGTNAFILTALVPFSGTAYEYVDTPSTGPVTGTAGIPPGATVIASAGGVQVKLATGRFSLETPGSGDGVGAPGQGRLTLHCRGSRRVCRARLSLAGGASGERVVVRLPGTDLRLGSVRPSRTDLRGAYSLSRRRYRTGGSAYAFTFSAVNAIRRGGYLTLIFARSPSLTG